METNKPVWPDYVPEKKQTNRRGHFLNHFAKVADLALNV